MQFSRKFGAILRASKPCLQWQACNSLLVILLALAGGLLPARAELALPAAEQAALQDDPRVAAAMARADAVREEAISDGQLPDPKLKLGLFNLPLDSFDLQQEPTTQLRFGVNQAFPRGDTLLHRQRRSEWRAQARESGADEQRRRLLQAVREDYLDLYFEIEAGKIIRASRRYFVQLVDITRGQFGAGRSNQQDVLRAELELSRLDDRATRIRNREEIKRAQLARWIGELARQELEPQFPELPAIPGRDEIARQLEQHPLLRMQAAQIEASRQGVEIARQQYKPGWNVGLEYRKRFGENPDNTDRTDMMAAMLSYDMPLFTDKRQDRRLAASQQRAEASRLDYADRLRKLKARLESEYANWLRLAEREQRYRRDLIRQASANVESSMKAYQSGLTEFITLMRARLTELDVRLDELRVRVDQAKAQARLLYLFVEEEQ